MTELEQDDLLSIGTRVDDGRTVVQLVGDLDVYSCARLRIALTGLSAAGQHRLAVELAELDFCDSSGLGVLVGAMKRARAGDGGLALVQVPDNLMRVLRITGLTKVLPAFSQLGEAFVYLDAQ